MKILSVVFSLIVVMSLSACGADVNLPEEASEPTEVARYEARVDYKAAYEEAKAMGDYVGMNKSQQMLGNSNFDYTHGGVVSTYRYSYENEGKEVKGLVYILKLPASLTRSELEAIADKQTVGENEYVVLDLRHLTDACMQVRNSYRAESPKEMKCVIDILLKYEEKTPTSWERTKLSLESEWYVHNLSYAAGYKVERAKHVDFNNADEVTYAVKTEEEK